MSIGDDKVRITITLTKELKEKLDEQAKLENRTTSNLVNNIAKKYLIEINED